MEDMEVSLDACIVKGPKGDTGDPGPQGERGEDGDSPYIGEDGYWYVGSRNTGMPATGPRGPEGKSAYELAAEGGYTGTEAEYIAAVSNLAVQVGGRNLLESISLPAASANCEMADGKTVRLGTAGQEAAAVILCAYSEMDAGTLYTLSCSASNVPEGTDGWSWRFYVTTAPYAGSDWILSVDRNGRISAAGKLPVGIAAGAEFYLTSTGGPPTGAPNIVLTDFKLERGNIPTDYTPAPEETAAAIAAAENTARTEAIAYTESLEHGGTNILRGTNAAVEWYPTDPETGGTVSGWYDRQSWQNGGWVMYLGNASEVAQTEVTDAPNPDIKWGWRIDHPTGTFRIPSQKSIPVSPGQVYTMSCYARVIPDEGETGFRAYFNISGAVLKQKNTDKDLTEAWTRCSVTFRTSGSAVSISAGAGPNGTYNTNGVFEICGMKLETGDVATDWSPSPWDMQGAQEDSGSGLFAMRIGEDGHLYVVYNDGGEAPPLSVNTSGHLIYTIAE